MADPTVLAAQGAGRAAGPGAAEASGPGPGGEAGAATGVAMVWLSHPQVTAHAHHDRSHNFLSQVAHAAGVES